MLVDTIDLQTRDEVVWSECKAILSYFQRIQSACGFNDKDAVDSETGGVIDLDHDGGLDPYISFAAASLQAIVLDIATEAWNDPLGVNGEGEATTVFFARPGDPLPSHFMKREPVMVRLAQPYVEKGVYIDHVMLDDEPETLGSRHHRFLEAIRRVNGLCQGLGIDKPAFEKVISAMIDRISAKSPVRDPKEVRTSYKACSRRRRNVKPKPSPAAIAA